MDENRRGPRELFIALGVAGAVLAVLMIWLGLIARDAPENVREVNRLLREQTLACAGRETPEKCREATRAVEEFKKKENSREERYAVSP